LSDSENESALLAANERSFRLIFEEAGVGLIGISPEGELLGNRAARELLGYREDEFDRLDACRLVAPSDLRLRPFDLASADQGYLLENQRVLLRKDGSRALVDTITRRLPNGELVVVLRDISRHEREAVNLRLVQDVAVAANAAVDLEEACQSCIERLCETHDFAVGHLWVPAPNDPSRLVSSGVWHPVEDARFAELKRVSSAMCFQAGDESLPSRPLSMKRPVWIPDVRSHPTVQRSSQARAAGLATGVALPVLARGHVQAVLEIFANDVREPDTVLISVLSHIGTILGRTAERRLADREISAVQSHLDLALRAARAGTWQSDLDGRHVIFDERLRELLGIEPETWTGLVKAVHPEDRENLVREFRKAMEARGDFSVEFRTLRSDGTPGVFETQGQVTPGPDEVPRLLAVTWEITERRDVEERLHRLSFFDPLTALPNRRAFQDRLEDALEESARNGGSVALLALNLDNFKQINESLGYRKGDRLIRQVADRLLDAMARHHEILPIEGSTERARLARVGGDEFALALTGRIEPEHVARVAQGLLDGLSAPFSIAEAEIFVSASIGIAVAPADGEDDDTLRTNAQAALTAARQAGGARYSFHAGVMNDVARHRFEIETRLRTSLRSDGLRLLYQPIVSTRTGAIAEAEALVRLPQPSGGFMSPGEFIPIAEETGLIHRLGDWVLRHAIRQGCAWHDAGRTIGIAVNISSMQLRTPGLAARIAELLRDAALPPERLTVEVTETAMIEDEPLALETLEQIRALGVGVALDDFGTGHSSLTRVNRFPLTRLKIDREFIRNVESDRRVETLIQCILTMGRSLGLETVGEGVETESDAEFLIEHGCDLLQGYLFAPPMEAEALERLLSTGFERKAHESRSG